MWILLDTITHHFWWELHRKTKTPLGTSYVLLRMRTQLHTITQIYAWYDISSFRIRTPLETKMHKLWWVLYSMRITWIKRTPLDTITYHLGWEIHGYDKCITWDENSIGYDKQKFRMKSPLDAMTNHSGWELH